MRSTISALLLASTVIVGTVSAAHADHMNGRYEGTGDAQGTFLDLVQNGTSLSGTLSGLDQGTLTGATDGGDNATGVIALPGIGNVDFRAVYSNGSIQITLVGPGGTQSFSFAPARATATTTTGAGTDKPVAAGGDAPAANAAQYFVAEAGQPVGPLTLDEVLARIEAGTTDADDLVWLAGAPDWVAAATLEELAAAFTPEPPPLPPETPPVDAGPQPPPLPPETPPATPEAVTTEPAAGTVDPTESDVAEALRDVVTAFVAAQAPPEATQQDVADVTLCVLTELEVFSLEDMQVLVDTNFQPTDADVERFVANYPGILERLDACTAGPGAPDDVVDGPAGGGARSEIGFNGHTIIVEGGADHSIESTPDGQRILVDGEEITVTETGITIDSDTAALPADFMELVITIHDDGSITITVDGMELTPD